MLDKIRFTVNLDRPYYQPGQTIEGHVVCDPHYPIDIDCVKGRLHGEAMFHFPKEHQSSSRNRVLVDEQVEFWRYCTLNEMLGLDEMYDENQNKQKMSTSNTSTHLSVPTTFPIRVRIPHFAPPSFHCPGSPINVRFTLEIQLMNKDQKIGSHEENLVVLPFQQNECSKKVEIVAKPLSFNKTFNFPKCRSIFVEMLLQTDSFSTTDKIDSCINISNNWKQSIKYVHLNIVRKISALNSNNETISLVKIDTTGVGLPSFKRKIEVGESYSFRPSFNIPALPPNAHVNGLFKADYSLKISIGRAYNFVLAVFEIPITITTHDYEMKAKSCREELLVDISSSNHNIFQDLLN